MSTSRYFLRLFCHCHRRWLHPDCVNRAIAEA